jgi:thiol-disulfide isomerase/thioredoxin
MKNTTLIICLILLSFVPLKKLRSQNKNIPNAVLSGEIVGMADSSLTVYITQWPGKELNPKYLVHSTTLQNGKFRFQLPLTELALISFSRETVSFQVNFAGESKIYLEPGDSIHLLIPGLDNPSIQDVEFTGKGAEKQLLLKTIGQKFKEILQEPEGPTLKDKFDRILKFQSAVHDVFMRDNTRISPNSRNAILAARMESFISSACTHLFEDSSVGDETKTELYKRYRNQLLTKQFHDEILAGNPMMIRDIQDIVLLDFLSKNNLPFTRQYAASTANMYNLLKQSYQDNAAKDFVLAAFIIRTLKLKGWKPDLKRIVDDYRAQFGNTNKYRIQVDEACNKFENHMQNKDWIYDLTLKDTAQRSVTLRQFRDKVVLIDFMYNGCAGCVSIRPKLEKLEHEFRDKDVAFVSVSVDKSLEHFKKGIGKFSSKGATALYTNGQGFAHPIIDQLGIISYPTLVLIDRNGMIVSARVPHLGTQKAEKELSALITQCLNLN